MAEYDIVPALLQLTAQENIHTAITVDIAPQQDWQGEWQYYSLNEVANLPFVQRVDLAIVNLLKSSTIQQDNINHAVMRLRDLLAKKVIVFADSSLAPHLRALGFTRLIEEITSDGVEIWQFNILTYKHVPDWFNAKFWANPENWDKYRW